MLCGRDTLQIIRSRMPADFKGIEDPVNTTSYVFDDMAVRRSEAVKDYGCFRRATGLGIHKFVSIDALSTTAGSFLCC